MGYQKQPSSRNDFEVAIICALALEFDAACLIIDEFWENGDEQYDKAIGDSNSYVTGRIGKHNVVVALLPQTGKSSSSSAAASLRSSYCNIKLAILVGICGGTPRVGEEQDVPVHLGDVVVSKQVVQYDFGRQFPGEFCRKDTVKDALSKPPKHIRNLLAILETDIGMERLRNKTASVLLELQKAASRQGQGFKYKRPGSRSIATTSGDQPPTDTQQSNAACSSAPAIFFGAIASADTVMMSAEHRERLVRDAKVIAFEMEASGVWEELPCIVVKGVADYADQEKKKDWQHFAAATAASVVKGILQQYIRTENPAHANIKAPQFPTATQAGSVFNSKVRGTKICQGNNIEVRSDHPRSYTQGGSHFGGDIKVERSVTQGNSMVFC